MGALTTPPIRTERLVLRRWRRSDLDAFAALNADAAVMEHFPAVMSRAESSAFLDMMQQRWNDDGISFAAVDLAETGECIGLAGLAIPRFDAPFMPTVEVGWRIASALWGQGYAPEAANGWLGYGFDVMGVDEIVSFTVAANANSRRVMDKLGMRHDAGGDFDHPGLPAGDPLRRHVLYRLSRAEWDARNGG